MISIEKYKRKKVIAHIHPTLFYEIKDKAFDLDKFLEEKLIEHFRATGAIPFHLGTRPYVDLKFYSFEEPTYFPPRNEKDW